MPKQLEPTIDGAFAVCEQARMELPPEPTGQEINRLLKLAKVSSQDERAVAWLKAAIESAFYRNRTASRRPRAVDHNDLLADVAKAASQLAKRLQRIRSSPATWGEFWTTIQPVRLAGFDRGAALEHEIDKRLRQKGPRLARRLPESEILEILKSMESAARLAKAQSKGRPPKAGKQQVIDLAFQFFDRHSPLRPGGSSSGPFGTFAHEFYYVALKIDPTKKGGGLDRQIRAAVKRTAVKNEHARPTPARRRRTGK